MISNITSGSDFGGLFRYLVGEVGKNGERREEIVFLGATVPGETPAEWAWAMNRVTALRPGMTVPVKHYSLRFAPEDIEGGKVNPEMMAEMAAEYVERMGGTAYVAIAHGHTKGVVDHFHMGVSKVRHDGGVMDDSFDYYKSQDICRDFEKRYGLRIVRSSNEIDPLEHKKQPTHYELATGDSNRLRLQSIVDAAMSKSISASVFAQMLLNVGVAARFNINKSGAYGISFVYKDMVFKGQSLGKSYTMGNLKKRGLSYVESRDLEKLDALGCVARSSGDQPRAEGDLEGSPANRGGSEEVRGADAGVDRTTVGMFGTSGSGNSELRSSVPINGRGDGREDPVDARPVDESSRGVVEAEQGICKGDEVRSEDIGDGKGSLSGDPSEPKKRRVREDVKALADLLGRGGAFDRIVSLAVADHIDAIERGGASGGEDSDRVQGRGLRRLFDLASAFVPRNTLDAIRKHISALAVERVEVAVLPPKDRSDLRVMPRKFWTPEEAMDPKNVRWLQAKNSQGYDIYVAPGHAENLGIVLLDDMTKDDVERMSREGFRPASVIETSKDNYQAWVRVSDDSLTKEEGTAVAEVLARAYGADPDAADWRHVGRLAGFTNRKAKHVQPNGMSPFVFLRYSKAGVAERGPQLVDAVRKMLEKREAAEPDFVVDTEQRIAAIRRSHNGYSDDPYSFFQHHAALLETRCRKPDGSVDWSDVDYGAAAEMIKHGFSQDEAISAMLNCSPLEGRKHNPQAYAERTVRKAMIDPGVTSHLRR